MFSILHISDLHRSQDEPLDNASLLASLVADFDRYLGEHPRIPPPEAIVVSGDLIQGVPLGTPNWEQSISDQYRIADAFLTELCDRFLNGERRSMILVPGNHDVCWNTSFQAMSQIAPEIYPGKLHDTLIKPGSNYRWSWSAQKLFRISNEVIYQQRMCSYWDFFERFYDGVDLVLPLDRSRGFHLFEVSSSRILLVAFESIDNNDCYSYSGAIAPGTVGKCAMALRDAGRFYDLKVAVWHHGIQGPPIRSDYMDATCVQEMAGHAFQLGLHGHQHVSGTLTQYVHLDQSRAMAVVGAGSLCAGARELPRGENRQYNLVVIEDDFLSGRVHVREMGDGEQFTRKRNGPFLDGFLGISWQPANDSLGAALDSREHNARRAIDAAEKALKRGRPSDAVQLLQNVDTGAQPYARKLKMSALVSLEEWYQLVGLLQTPLTVEEQVVLVTALIACGELDDAEARLATANELDSGTRGNLQERLEAQRLMRQP